MSLSDLAWLKYPLVTLVLLAVFGVLGVPAWALVRRRLPTWMVLLAPSLGVAWVMVVFSWYAKLGTELPSWLTRGLTLVVVAGLLTWALLADARSAARRSDGGAKRLAWDGIGLVLPWVIGVTVVTAFMVPVITTPYETSGFLTIFTFGNADVGAYIGEASNVLRAGFDDAGLYFGWNPGSNPLTFSADQDHTGANALLAFIASILGTEVWKIAQITLMVACAATLTGAVAVVRALLPGRTRVALAIGTFASSSLMVWYLVGNYFLAQVLCLALMMAQLAVLIASRDRRLDWRILATLAPLAAATWLSSPELQLVFFLLAGALFGAEFVASLVVRAPGAFGDLWRSVACVALSLGGAAILILPFMASNISRSQRVYETTAAGWKLDLQSTALAVFGYPEAFGARSDLGWFALLVVGLALVAGLAWALYRRSALALMSGVFAVGLIAAGTFGALKWGFDGYQSWKLILTLSVPFLLFVGVLFVVSFKNEDNQRAAVTLVLILTAVNVMVGARMWDQARSSDEALRYASISSELATFLADPRVQSQNRLNIYVPSLYGTMIAPAMYGKKAAMSSTSYYSGAQPNAKPYACSLVDASIYKKRMGTIAYANHGYLLVNTPRCS